MGYSIPAMAWSTGYGLIYAYFILKKPYIKINISIFIVYILYVLVNCFRYILYQPWPSTGLESLESAKRRFQVARKAELSHETPATNSSD